MEGACPPPALVKWAQPPGEQRQSCRRSSPGVPPAPSTAPPPWLSLFQHPEQHIPFSGTAGGWGFQVPLPQQSLLSELGHWVPATHIPATTTPHIGFPKE